ncbi:MAG: MurR/RpiR family transcriptional regulator [Chloroflexi bacterium]|uniref:MurR/RpiR family transcriptional regulator n=1 Tax=Candidatus Chlorohelix allophototropha TaxID=3003348 RepID=A0A8T7M5P5_9CHLR|nr:MurR/RpiR family transcriptional regulator [Chloroflexota bacterium]WJW69362.1 MurR/RpiR family transcriptional regulator [Chloroflexota bacterium L227-S17]
MSEIINTSGEADTIQLTSCIARIETALINNTLFPAERKVAEYIIGHPHEVTTYSVNELARVASASEATVVRFCRALAFTGYKDFKLALAAESSGAVSIIHEDISRNDDVMTITGKLFRSDLQAIADSLQTLDRQEMERAVDVLSSALKIEFYGNGSSAPAAIDAYYRFIRIGLPATVVTDSYMQAVSSTQLKKGEVAFAISHTGRTEEAMFALRKARENGATTICLTSNVRGPITEFSDIKLITTARETAFRNMAMASRIAHLSVIDALYVNLAMRRFDKAQEKVHQADNALNERRKPGGAYRI